MHPLIQSITKSQEKRLPPFRVGDQIRIWVKITDVGGERTQAFEGIVIRMKGQGASGTFTARKISFGIGVERTFPFQSPHIDKLEVLKSTRVRRARLYYLRKLSGKAARIEEKESSGPAAVDTAAKANPSNVDKGAPAAKLETAPS